MLKMGRLTRTGAPTAVGLLALLFVLANQIGTGGLSVSGWIWAGVWVGLTLAVAVCGILRPALGQVFGVGFVCLVGFIAALWPLAFLVAEDPIVTEVLTMRTLLPNVLLIVLCWLALYIIPSQSADRASQRLFWQFSSPAGRLLMLALLLTMLFYTVVSRILMADTESALGASPALTAFLELFVGTNVLYFVIVTISFWGVLLATTLTVRAFGTSVDLSEQIVRDGFWSAVDSDRRVLGVLIAVLPLLGFLGTVVGISAALAGLEITLLGSTYEPGDIQGLLRESLGGLSLAFETTILGIASSAALLILTSFIDKGLSAPGFRPQETETRK